MDKKIFIGFILILAQAGLMFAQNTTGKIIGTVSAADGAVPGATILVTDNQTGKERTVTATNDGTFEVPQLEFGTYTVKITASGFKTFTATEVKIDTGREYPLKAQLEVGQITEQVTITAGAEQINGSNAELSTTITERQIKDLPLNGRNPLSLAYLQAGSSVTTNSINGQRASSTTITRDGMNIQDNFIRTGSLASSAFNDSPTVDNVSEFTLTTQNSGVEQGGGVAQVRLVTPRGGSEYHGSLYAFNRNSAFTANTFFGNASGLPRPFLNRNQYGGSFSGPLPLPHLGEGGPFLLKDKAFFFFNYEGFRLAQQTTLTTEQADYSGALQNITLLLPQARTGNFTFTNAATGQSSTINVLSGTGFSSALTAAQGGVLTVDPVIQSKFLSNLPDDCTTNTLIGVNFQKTCRLLRSAPQIRDQYVTRVDVNINDRNSVSGVYRHNNGSTGRTDLPAGFSTVPFVTSGGPSNFFTAAYNWSPTNNFSNEFRGGLNNAEVPFTGTNNPSDYFIRFAAGSTLVTSSPLGAYETNGRNTYYRNYQDNAVYTLGNHSLRFGASLEQFKIIVFDSRNTIPAYTIATTANPNTPGLTASQVCGTTTCINATELARANALRYFLGGIVGAASRTANLRSPQEGYTFGGINQNLNYEIYAAYLSDQWRLRPNFTVNLGVRYDYYTPLNNKESLYLEPVINNNDLAASLRDPNGSLNVVGTNSGKPGDFTKPDRDNFSPSVSVAYSPRFENGFMAKLFGGGTVIRGGFRFNYVNDEYVKSVSTLSGANPGLGGINISQANLRTALTARGDFGAVPPLATLPAFNFQPISFAQNNINQNRASRVFGVDPNIEVPLLYEYNVGIQREIGFNTVFEIRYVGSRGSNFITTQDFNQADLVTNGFTQDFFRAQANLAANDAERTKRINALVAGGATVAAATTTVNTQFPRSFGNTGVAGTVALPVFSQTLVAPTSTTFIPFLEQGRIASFAQNTITLGQRGNVVFQPNPNILFTEILTNSSRLRYNSLQAEIRHRFRDGLYFQVNYTFAKTLTDTPDDGQNRESSLQDQNNPNLQYARSDFDRTHVLNASFIYELPFGKGKSFLNEGGWVDKLIGGFQIGSIISVNSGPPLGVIDPRGTTNLAFFSGRQSATSTLTGDQIRAITGKFDTPNGIYFVNPQYLFATITNATTGQVQTGFDLNQPLPAGFQLTSVRGASPIGTAPFPNQVFFFTGPGQTGNLPRNFLNGLPYANWDASLIKNLRFGERIKVQLRAEVFNVLNKQLPSYSADLNVDSNTFGRVTTTNTAGNPSGPRIVQFGARFDF
jgi:hypothetical protein